MSKLWNHIRGCPDTSSCTSCVSATTASFQPQESNPKKTPIVSRRQHQQQRWLQRLQETSQRVIMSTSNNNNNNNNNSNDNTTTNYEPMPDPMESMDPKTYYRRQQSSSRNLSDYSNDDYLDETEEEVYIVKQSYGYFAILFSVAQTLVLVIMMIQCGMAPLNINPMIGPFPGTFVIKFLLPYSVNSLITLVIHHSHDCRCLIGMGWEECC
jgi:hypothetical protein